MRGGVLLVDGNAGNEVGATMRRGMIAVKGAVGDFVGVGMIAGSVLVFGQPGARPGAAMKRGTLGFFGPRPALLPTFRKACDYSPLFLHLYLKQLREWGFAVDTALVNQQFERYSGDLIALGKGEILVAKGAK
jgi:formylmethanofuran dehydrogenase subunit C